MAEHLTRTLTAIRLVADRPDPAAPLGVGTVARELGIGLSAASRLCSELDRTGMLARGSAHGTYRLGPRALRLSGRAAAPTARAVRYALTLAAQQTGETAYLAAGGRVIASVDSVWTLFAPADVGEPVQPGSASVEVGSAVRDPAGDEVATVAVRIAANRAGRVVPRAERAVAEARRGIERALAGAAPPPSGPRPAEPSPTPAASSTRDAALRILEHLADCPATPAGLAAALGLRVDRVQRLAAACRDAGLVDRAGSGRLGLSWVVHGWYRAAQRRTLAEAGRPIVEAAAERIGVSGFITVLKGMRSLTLVEALQTPPGGLRMASWLGRPSAILESDGGPTLLLDVEGDDLTRLFPVRHTPHELETFARRGDEVRRHGVLVMESLDDLGFVSISAPIRDVTGTVVAAACFVGPSGDVNPRSAAVQREARDLGHRLSELAGFVG